MKLLRSLPGWLASLVLGLLLAAGSLRAADSLNWKPDSVAAEISSWDLPKVLQKLTEVTGWQIYVEPDAKQTISTKFKDRPQGEALRSLLGDLNFALLPALSNGPPRLFVFRTTMQEATQLVKLPEKKVAKPIPNELVVRLKPGKNIDEIAKKVGAKVIGRADKFNTYRLQFEDAEAAAKARSILEQDSDVESVESNFPVSRPPTPDSVALSSYSPLDLKPKANPDSACDKLIVGVVDTGVQNLGTGLDGFLRPSISVAGESTLPEDEPTHGTAMLETMFRSLAVLSKNGQSSVVFQPVNVYGNNASTSTFDVAMGIYQAVNSGARIVNLSLGSEGSSPFLQKMIKDSHDQGVVFFASAGNEPVATPTYPAAYPEVIAVTAGTRQGTIAPYANYGSFVDAIAPGSSLVNYKGQSWLVTGTSASSAYASGIAAAMLESSCGLTGPELEAQVRAAIGLRRQ